ncbi:MAG: glycosyltransferase family 2 protein [Streptosporangiales bacterium]
MAVDVVLPCLDEAAALGWVIDRMPAGYHAVVADNGSRDGSAAIAAARGADVVTVPQRGFGAACHAGLLAASTDVVCVMDADASLDPAELPRVAGPVLDGSADLVLGRRNAPRGTFPPHARVANAVLACALGMRTGVRVHDLGPMRAGRRAALLDLDLRDRRFGYPLEMLLRAGQRGWRVDEVPVGYRLRAGRSKVTGTVRGTLRTIHDMARVLAT